MKTKNQQPNKKITSKIANNIWKLKIYYIFNSLAFFLPIIVLFWQDNGLNMTQIMLLQSIYAITIVIIEVPTGYFADIYGRNKTLTIAAVFTFIGMLIYSIGFNFFHFLIAEIIWGIGCSLLSGTDSALLYDTLKDLKKESQYKKIMGNAMFYRMLSMGFANVVGGFIGAINFRWTFYALLPFLFILIPITTSIQEPSRHKLIIKKGYTQELFKIVKQSLVDNYKLRWLMIYSGIIFAFNQSVLWFYQPYMSLSGIDVFYFGFVFASFQIVAAISSKYAHKIEERLGRKYSLVMLFVLVSVSYLLMSNFVYLFSFSFAFIQQFIRSFRRVIISDYVNQEIKSNIRATVLSVENLVGKVIYAIIAPIMGWIADVYSLLQALTVLGITVFVIGGIFIIVLYKNKVL